ncbi:hypothetical protein [Salinigranum sp. GCM10025319]|uniref:hypothetical protein n=1 Tax=Salinigranum sp. GCM10025319 TaxID=3252687 RepID=UPI0036065F0D
MDARYSWLAGAVVGLSIGYLFGIQRGDVVLGAVLTIVWTITAYGLLAFPEHRAREPGSHSRFWYSLVGVLAPIVMFTPQYSSLLSPIDGLPLVLLLGGVWLGGVYAGAALERAEQVE